MDYGSDSESDSWEQGYGNFVPQARIGYGSDSESDSWEQGYGNYVPQARIGYPEVVEPEKGGSRAQWSTYKGKQITTNDSQSYEMTSRTNHQEKQSGSYERYTAKEKVSFGEPHRERGKGQVGVRDESKRSSTVKIGDKSGYTEYYNEERVRKVTYANNSSSGKNGSSKRIIY